MQMKLLILPLLAALSTGFLLSGCTSAPEEKNHTVLREKPLFSMLGPQDTGIEFSNTLRQNPGPSSNQLLYDTLPMAPG